MNLWARVRAFTLVELLLVVSIIAILAIIALPNFQDAQTRSKVAAVKNNLREVALKLEMLQTDSNRYPLAAKWRRVTFWSTPDPNPDDAFQRALLAKTLTTLYGPHEDLFEYTALQQLGLLDAQSASIVNGQFLFNGFGFFHLPTMVRALSDGCSWQGSDLATWSVLRDLAGDWLLYSCGPDLVAESPTWLTTPAGTSSTDVNDGYNEKQFFHDYDPTNGTVSYGNIFRTQRNPAGLGMHSQLY